MISVESWCSTSCTSFIVSSSVSTTNNTVT
jgi:hypothetical protein